MTIFLSFAQRCRAAFAATFFLFSPLAFGQDATIDVGKILVDDSVRMQTELSSGSFSVGARVNILTPGNETGNGDRLGMIFSAASGWFDGFRAYYDWRSGNVVFQIGRVKEQSAISVRSSTSFVPGIMRDVVCVFDANSSTASLYVDGKNVGSTPFSGTVETKNASLSVGFGGSGVGSNRMFVDKLEYWKRALTPDEIAARNAKRSNAELVAVRAVERVASADNAANVSLDAADYETALQLALPNETKAKIRRDYLAKLLFDKDFEKAAPLALETAQALLDSNELDALSPTQRLNRVLETIFALTAVAPSLDETQRREARRLFNEIDQKFADEKATVKNVEALIGSADRVRQIETDAQTTFRAACDQLDAEIAKGSFKTICVAPNGSDTNDGSSAAPVATLAKAFELASKIAAKSNSTAQTRPVVLVELADGVYRVDRTARLANVANVVVRPANGAKPVLTGASEIDNFQALNIAVDADATVAETATRFQEAARDKIFVANLTAAGIADFGRLAARGYGTGNRVAPIPSLYVDGESQTLARWPNEGAEPLKFGEIVAEPDEKDAQTTTFRFDFDRPNDWKLSGDPAQDDVWAFGLFEWEWAANCRRVERIDRDAKTLTVAYKNANDRFHYYFVDVLEELDAPGEYYVDRASGLLYFYPPKNLTTADALNAAQVEFDVFDEVFIAIENSQRVVLQGLALRGGRESGVAFEKCAETYFVDGKIEQFGGNAAILSGGSFCAILNSRLRELGASGVRISGGVREKLVRCNHLLSNCFISDFSRIDRVYAPALHFAGCGVAATNNLICDSPHHAMRTDGNDIYIARNEIHSVVYEYSDQSGIDIFCDPTFRGIVIEENLWRHIGSAFALCGQAGIRLDDSISGVVMLKNVFYRSSGGMFGGIQIHGGKDNVCFDNLFVDCKQAFSFSIWSNDRYLKFVRERFPKNVDNPAFLDAYPLFDEIFENPNRNFIVGNDAVNCERFNNKGDEIELFSGNRVREVAEPDSETLLNDANALRVWLAELAGRSLENIGLRENWNGANAPVSPNYSLER